MEILPPPAAGAAPSPRPVPVPDPALRTLAEAFEAQFVAEMLKHSGLNSASSEFGGGAGEDAFSSFLTEAYATKLTEAGGLGLAESIYRAMVSQGD